MISVQLVPVSRQIQVYQGQRHGTYFTDIMSWSLLM